MTIFSYNSYCLLYILSISLRWRNDNPWIRRRAHDIREIDRYVSIDRTSARRLVKRRRKATIMIRLTMTIMMIARGRERKRKREKKKSNYCHETRTRASRLLVTRLCVQVEKRKKKREKMKNKTSIKYMRGPWRGGNLPFIRAKEEKKKKIPWKPRPDVLTLSATSVDIPVAPRKKREKKKRDKFKAKKKRYKDI